MSCKKTDYIDPSIFEVVGELPCKKTDYIDPLIFEVARDLPCKKTDYIDPSIFELVGNCLVRRLITSTLQHLR